MSMFALKSICIEDQIDNSSIVNLRLLDSELAEPRLL